MVANGKPQLVLTANNAMEREFLTLLFEGKVDVKKMETAQILGKNFPDSYVVNPAEKIEKES